MNLFSKSNQNGAPSERAKAVMIQPGLLETSFPRPLHGKRGVVGWIIGISKGPADRQPQPFDVFKVLLDSALGVSPLAHASGVPAGFGVTDGAGVEPAFVVVFALAGVTPEEFELLPDAFELPFEFVAEVLFAPGLFALPFDDLFAFEFVGGFVSEPPAFDDPAEFAFVD
jgi:hypothetical protein